MLQGIYEVRESIAGLTTSKQPYLIRAGTKLRIVGRESHGLVTVEVSEDEFGSSDIVEVLEMDVESRTRPLVA